MNILVIEDETLAAKKLINLLNELESNISIVQHLSSIEESKKWFSANESPDLIFSDIQLGDGLSFEIFQELNLSCPIIFTTAYDQYAIKAFEVNSIDYLLKPIKSLQNSLEKYHARKEAWKTDSKAFDVNQLLSAINQAKNNYKSRFLVKLGNKIHTVKSEEIAYFYSDQKLSVLVDKNGSKYPMDNSLEEISQQLDPELFFRINRKYVIHLDAADEIKPYFKGRLKLKLNPDIDDDIIVSSEKTPSFKEWLDH
jgi:DNA-binding LytR/AlgR family response regulator